MPSLALEWQDVQAWHELPPGIELEETTPPTTANGNAVTASRRAKLPSQWAFALRVAPASLGHLNVTLSGARERASESGSILL